MFSVAFGPARLHSALDESMRTAFLQLMCVLCAIRVIAEDPKPSQLPQNVQRVDKAQKAIDDLLVQNKELSFVSRVWDGFR